VGLTPTQEYESQAKWSSDTEQGKSMWQYLWKIHTLMIELPIIGLHTLITNLFNNDKFHLLKLTNFLSFIDPFPLTKSLHPVVDSTSRNVIPRGPITLPTKLNWNAKHRTTWINLQLVFYSKGMQSGSVLDTYWLSMSSLSESLAGMSLEKQLTVFCK